MILPAILLAAALFNGPIEILVLHSGHQIAVAGPIREDGTRLVFRTPAGVLYSLAVDEIDLDATEQLARASDPAEDDPEPASEAVTPLPRRKLAVSEEEKQRLLDEISQNREGKPAPEQRSLSGEGLEEELERLDREREERKREERFWREKAGPLRERLEQARDEVAMLEARVRRLEDEVRMVYSLGLDPTGQLYQLDVARNGLEGARQRVLSAERAWAELQEQARRAEALPGWLR